MKINQLPKKQQEWLARFEFNLDADINEPQSSPTYLNEANHGTPIWCYTPLELAISECDEEHIRELIKHGALNLEAGKSNDYLFVQAFNDNRPGVRVRMVKLLLEYIPVTQNVIDIANKRFSEGTTERISNFLFSFFNGENVDSLANKDILIMLNHSHSSRQVNKLS